MSVGKESIALETFLQILVTGLTLGALYALASTGLALVWGTLGMFNMAHGMFMTTGAYGAFVAVDFSTLTLVLSMVVVGGLGSTWGPFVGAAAILIGIEWLTEIGDAKNIGLGLVLILVVLIASNGMAALLSKLAKAVKPSRQEQQPSDSKAYPAA